MSDFAEVSDLVDGWRPLSLSEKTTAGKLISRASRKIRARRRDIDARIADGSIDADLVNDVVCGMVKRAMITSEGEGVQSQQETDTHGPFSTSTSRTYANPMGALYLSKEDLRDLGIGVKRASAIDLGPGSSSPSGDWP